MNRQEIFDTVAKHLLAQMKQSKLVDQSGDAFCAYRSDDGKKCAVGALIPDELYDPDMEDKGCEWIVQMHPDLHPYLVATDISYGMSLIDLRRLQAIHDKKSPDVWKDVLREHAYRNGLKWSQP